MLELAGYSELEPIHRGQRSLVLRGRRDSDGSSVVIKTPRADFPGSADLSRLRYEYQLGRSLEGQTQTHFVRHLALEPVGSSLALVLEDFGARSLEVELKDGGLPVSVFLDLAVTLAEAVRGLHQASLVHLDINPTNILYAAERRELRLCDLSAAARLDAPAIEQLPFRSTPAYAAPEQVQRTEWNVDLRTDLYSLGVTLFQLLTGRLPFAGADALETFHLHLAHAPPSPRDARPDIPEVLAQILLKLLSKNPDERYRSAGGLAADLARCRREQLTHGALFAFELGADDRSPRLLLPRRLYGREREVVELTQALETASAGKNVLFLVSGEAGVGKSALVEGMQPRVRAQGGHYCAGKFEALGSGVPYGAFSNAFRTFLRAVLAGPAPEREAWRTRLLDALGPNGQLLVRLVPELAGLIGPQPEVPLLEPEQAHARFSQLVLSLARGVASREHLFVIFLDDVQWADQASLSLLEQLALAEDLSFFLIVGAYRKAEVTAGHPLTSLIERVTATRPPLTLELEQLELPDVERMVADSISHGVGASRPLGRLVWRKTRGNPFFVGQFLRMLFAEKLLWFEASLGVWRWDLDACEAQRITDNVVDLMVRRIHRLGDACQRALRSASCIGTEFELGTLSELLRLPPADTRLALSEALGEQLITLAPLLPGDERLEHGPVRFRFLHDQVQQAAYAMIPEPERAPAHLALVRLLLAAQPVDPPSKEVFVLMDQLGRGRALVSDTAEQAALARLCLHAGRHARAANAYAAASSYLEWGLELLGPTGWQREYKTALALSQEHAETSYLRGELSAMERNCEAIVVHASALLDKLPAYRLRITAEIAKSDLPSAIRLARDVLAMLGVHLPKKPGKASVLARVTRMAWRMRRETVESLLARPRAQDPLVLAAAQILALVATAAYLSSPNLFPLVICELLTLSLRHGNTDWSADGYLGWGAIEIAAFGAIERGYAIGSAAPRLTSQLGASARQARIATSYHLLIHHWVEPLRSTVQPLRHAVLDAVEHGDLASAAAAATTDTFYSLASGLPLAEVEEIAATHEALLRRLGHQRFGRDARRMLQLVHCLQGKARDPRRLDGEFFDEEEGVRAATDANDPAAIASISFERALLLYLHGDPQAALECCRTSARHLQSVLSTVYPSALDLIASLARARVLSSDDGAAGGKELRAIEKSLRRLERWAKSSPENQQHRVHLVRAELARLKHDRAAAIREYELAIELSGRHGYMHEQAMALECAGRFYAALRHDRLAATSLSAARAAWLAWGANAKARALEREFPSFCGEPAALPRASSPPLLGPRTELGTVELAASSVLKASQAIVGEIRLPNLVRRLIALAMEHTGAQRGFLLVNKPDGLWIEAAADIDQPEASASVGSLKAATEARELLPLSIIDYVARLGEPVLEVDLGSNELYAHDAYVAAHKPLSVLCVPLLSQGVLGGVVYLENNRMRGAFSTERLEVLRVLSSLAAISLQNARLYEDVARAHALQVKLSKAQARFVPQEFLHSLNRTSIMDVALGDNVRKEMSILFSDVRGFTPLVEKMSPQQHIGFINGYLGHMEPAIVDNGGFVDSYLGDGIMALFESEPDGAVRAAIKMSQELTRFNAGRAEAGLAPIEMGVGISTGPLTLGTIGGPTRIKCGVIGDPVNLASRLESLTKYFKSFMLISDATHSGLKHPEAFKLRRVDRVRVVGMTAPITLYEVLDAEQAPTRETKLKSLTQFEGALDAYGDGRFEAAAQLFEVCARSGAGDGAAKVLAERCREFSARPPANWDGVFTLQQK
jgi:predicted ATPase/class 3 adenylate cyclase